MRILLIAYEFPPSPSPQALRWAYLVRELANLGHQVDVLTADAGALVDTWPHLPDSVRLHRTFAGPFRGALAWRQRCKEASPGSDATPAGPAPTGDRSLDGVAGVNWKYRLVRSAQRLLATALFPDERGEWQPWARRRLRRLLYDVQPHVVIASHEPATSLQLGLLARRGGVPLLADLGDPVLAPYTPARWQRRSRLLERQVCADADHIVVTSEATRALLVERHGRAAAISVLTQGHDDRFDQGTEATAHAGAGFDPSRLELLYTGNFYRFRRPDALIEALKNVPGVRLTVATPAAPATLLQACRDAPGSFRLLGLLSHPQALALQRQADVLVHIANDQATQVPGKLYEYLGARRPILYLGRGDQAAARLLSDASAGWVVDNSPHAIGEQLLELTRIKRDDVLPTPAAMEAFTWQRIALQLQTLLESIARPH